MRYNIHLKHTEIHQEKILPVLSGQNLQEQLMD